MSQRPPPSLVDFMGRVLQYEIEQAGDAGHVFDGFQRICRALHDRLSPLISSTGFHTLFGRAQRLAARDFPALAEVSIEN